jgi:hypothetical protein
VQVSDVREAREIGSPVEQLERPVGPNQHVVEMEVAVPANGDAVRELLLIQPVEQVRQ